MRYERDAWNYSSEFGSVYIDKNGNVERSTANNHTVYPYRARMVRNGFGEWKQDGWDICNGCYKPSYLARLMREGKAKWS